MTGNTIYNTTPIRPASNCSLHTLLYPGIAVGAFPASKNGDLRLSEGQTEQNLSSGNLLTARQLTLEMTHAVLPVTVLIGCEAIMGLMGNLLILVIYSRWYKPCNFRCFVLCMGIIDLASCLTTLPGEVFSQINWYTYTYDHVCKVKSYFNVFTCLASAITLLLLAFDRYRKICHPLAWQIPTRTATKMCIIGIVAALIISVPTAFLWGKQTYLYTIGNQSINVSICEKSDSFDDATYPFLYMLCAYIIPVFIIIGVTSVLNCLTARNLRQSFKNAEFTISNAVSLANGSSSQHCVNFTRTFPLADQRRHRRPPRRYSLPSNYISFGRRTHKTNGHFYDEYRQVRDIPNIQQQVCDKHGSVESGINVISGRISNRPHHRSSTFPHAEHHSNGSQNANSTESNDSKTGSVKSLLRWRHDVTTKMMLRRRRKTLIMLILTSVFTITMVVYLTLLALVASEKSILQELQGVQKVVFFLFWRLYFINSVINPILYGFMDNRFRRGLYMMFCETTKLHR